MRTSFEKMLEENHEPINLPLEHEGEESPRSAFKRARDKSLKQLSDRISGPNSRKSASPINAIKNNNTFFYGQMIASRS